MTTIYSQEDFHHDLAVHQVRLINHQPTAESDDELEARIENLNQDLKEAVQEAIRRGIY